MTEEVEVIHLTDDEWSAAAQRALDRLGCTYDELADMAARRYFLTHEHNKLWTIIGGMRT